jgi:hypothetical protein
LSEDEFITGKYQNRLYVDGDMRSFFGSYSGEKRFRNPCMHHTDRDIVRGCLDCEISVREFGPHYDDPQKRLGVVTIRTEFDETVCVNKAPAEFAIQDSRI